MAKKRKSETPPAASPLARSGSGLADSGEAVSGMAPTSRPYYESKFALNELPTEVTARVNPALNAPYDDIDLQHAIAQEHWYVCGYKMNMKHPITEETHHLFHDADPSTPMFRVVVKANLSMPMADNLIASIAKSFAFLSVHNQIVGASHIFICAQVPRRARRGLQQPSAPRAPAAPQGVLGARRWRR